MSFDIFIGAFRGGDTAWYPRTIVERAFNDLIMGDPADKNWELALPDGRRSGSMSIDSTQEVSGFAINRPSGHPIFWNAILDVLRQTPSVLCWPGVGPHPRVCVAHASAIPELPPDMIESLGYPTIVNSPEDINECISLSA